MWYCSQTGVIEEKEKEAGNGPSLKKAPEGSWPNGNEPQGLLCFAGRSSACENLWNKAVLNYLSQRPTLNSLCPAPPCFLCITAELAEPLSFPVWLFTSWEDGQSGHGLSSGGNGDNQGTSQNSMWMWRHLLGRTCLVCVSNNVFCDLSLGTQHSTALRQINPPSILNLYSLKKCCRNSGTCRSPLLRRSVRSVICGCGFPPCPLHGSGRCYRWRWCGCCPRPWRCPPCHEGGPHYLQRRPLWWRDLHQPVSQSRIPHCSVHTAERQGCRSRLFDWGEMIGIYMRWCHYIMTTI